MTLSVIIPTLNEEKALGHTLASLPTCTTTDTIIVDGGSTDRTVRIAEAFCADKSNARIITASAGRARQMNEGAKACRGDILLFLHADTSLPPAATSTITSALGSPGVTWGRFDVCFDSSSPWATIVGTLMNRRSRWSGIATGDQAVFVRRHIFEQLGGFPDLPLMEDIALSRKLKRTGNMAALYQTVTTSFRRWEQRGPLKTIFLMWSLRFLYWAGVNPARLDQWYKLVR